MARDARLTACSLAAPASSLGEVGVGTLLPDRVADGRQEGGGANALGSNEASDRERSRNPGSATGSRPKTVEIVPTGDGAWFLLRYDEAGLCRADTWHQSVEQAKECARQEYGITDADWVE